MEALELCGSTEVDTSLVRLADVPIGRRDVVGGDGLFSCEASEPEGEGLASQCSKGLVGSSPVVAHSHPIRLASLHPHGPDVSGATHVHHVHQEPVAVPLELEPDPPGPHARYPAVSEAVVNGAKGLYMGCQEYIKGNAWVLTSLSSWKGKARLSLVVSSTTYEKTHPMVMPPLSPEYVKKMGGSRSVIEGKCLRVRDKCKSCYHVNARVM